MPEFSFNIVAGEPLRQDDHGAPVRARQCDAGRPALHFTILGASRGINAMAFQGLSYRRPLAPHRHYHQSQAAPARGNERMGPSWRCGLRYSARSTVEATRKADEHRPGTIICLLGVGGLEYRDPGALPPPSPLPLASWPARLSWISTRLQLGRKAKSEETKSNRALPRTLRKNLMHHHVKKLMYTVRVDEPDPRFGKYALEQFGGANGELAAAMQYSVQGLNCEDAAEKEWTHGHRNGGTQPS